MKGEQGAAGQRDGRHGDADPFDALGIAPCYDIDPAVVRTAHLRKVAALHPDRIADPVRRQESARELASANEASVILLDAERRADALLRRLGGPAKEEDRTLPDGFLVETMELREAMEEATASDDPSRRAAFAALVADRRRGHHEAVGVLFARATASPSPELLTLVRHELNAWRYVERMAEALRETR